MRCYAVGLLLFFEVVNTLARAPKHCARCDTLVVGRTYCDDCRPVGWRSHSSGSWRDSPEYKAWRDAVLERASWFCEIRGERCTGTATQADHIRNVREGGARFDVSNGQAACAPCHKAKTQDEAQRGRARARAPRP